MVVWCIVSTKKINTMFGIFSEEYLRGQMNLTRQACGMIQGRPRQDDTPQMQNGRRICEIVMSDSKDMLRELEQFCDSVTETGSPMSSQEGAAQICALTVPVRHCVNVVSAAHTQATGKAVDSNQELQIMIACGMVKGITADELPTVRPGQV
jgi:hypothetical protein